MIRICSFILIFFAGFAHSAATAAGCERTITVRSGQPATFDELGLYNTRTCRTWHLMPQIGFREKPKHGKVTHEYFTEELGRKAGKCAGRTLRSKKFIYTSKKGYRGRDSFTYGVGTSGYRQTCKINVRVR